MFPDEVATLQKDGKLSCNQKLLLLHPFLDQNGVLCIGGRQSLSTQPYATHHPILLPGKHTLTKLIIRSKHLRLLHADPTLVASSLSTCSYILGGQRAIRAITRSCVVWQRVAVRPHPLLLGQLPADRLDTGPVFDRVGIDYAGPVLIKSSPICRPIITKAYVCVFVSFTTKAVHLELVSDLITAALIAML